MRVAVREAFIPFTSPLEGVVPWMYLDILGLVTTGIGNLIDPIDHALACPFVRRGDEARASPDEIASEWRSVKGHKELAIQGHRAARQYTTLYLTDEGVRTVVFGKLDEMVTHLVGRFPAWHAWPADAQLATLSMSWACGPAFRFQTLAGALAAQAWHKASQSCHINTTGNPGLIPRNALNEELYRNAEWVVAQDLDPDTLVWAPPLPPEAA